MMITSCMLQQERALSQPVGRCQNAHELMFSPWQLTCKNNIVARVSGHAGTPSSGLSERGGVACEVSSSVIARHDFLWGKAVLDPTPRCGNLEHESTFRCLDFKQWALKEVLWLDNFWKLHWVDDVFAASRMQLKPCWSVLTSTSLKDSGCRWIPGYEIGEIAETVCKLCEKGELRGAVDALGVILESELQVSVSLFYRVLQLCIARRDSVLGRRVHDYIVIAGYECNTFLSNHILRMYAYQGKLREATDVFNKVANPDAFMWSSIISAHAKHGEAEHAIRLYKQMRNVNAKPDVYVFVAALQACASAADLESGRQVHSDVMRSGIQPNLFVWNCLLDMYAKCGRLGDARKIFDSLVKKDVVTWTVMIAAYGQNDEGQEALSLHERMEAEGTVLADTFAFACLIKACARMEALEQGKHLHAQMLERGVEFDVVVGSCLVDMYAKCGRLEDARKVFDCLAKKDVVTSSTMVAGYAKCGRLEEARCLFDGMITKNVVTWNAMIAGYSDHGLAQVALSLHARMEQEGLVTADRVTFAHLLKACSKAGALQQGKLLHSEITRKGLEADAMVGSCLIDMYANCGKPEVARQVFDSLPTKDVATWTMMINGFGQSNEAQKAIECFQEMMQYGVQANEITFTCLLVACSHAGLVKEGQQFIKSMEEEFGIKPTLQHYTCMVDLLGRAGYLEEAEKFLFSFKSDDVGFLALLNACRSHGDVERGARCFASLTMSESGYVNVAAYVLMGNIYADAGKWSDVERIEMLRKFAGASKDPAVAGIEVDRHVHTFVVGEQDGDISSKLRSVSTRLKEGGHLPHTELVLKQASEMQKEEQLCGHAEKLALAYGLLNTPEGTPLLVTKNMRMCSDCHSSTEIMSRVEKREIVVRDAHRVHRFVDGACRCGGKP